MGSGNQRTVTGAFVGTGANIDIRSIGFRPSMVKIINVNSDDSLQWFDTMADAAGLKSVKAGSNAMISTGGVTPLSDGFRLGNDADLNVSGEFCHYVATE